MSIEIPQEALATSIRDVVAAVRQTGDTHGWEFTPTSPARADWTAYDEPSNLWGAHVLEDAYRTGSMFWYLMGDQALAVADLLTTGRPLALLSTSRSLAEASCRGWYLLTTQATPDERIRRMVNDRLHALYEDQQRTQGIPLLASTWRQEVIDRLLATADSLGLRVNRPRRGAPSVGADGRPSAMRLLGETIANDLYARLFYRNTSGLAHAALHTLVLRLDMRQASPEDRYKAELPAFALPEAVAEMPPSITAFAIAARALISQAGWDLRAFNGAERVLTDLLSHLIRS